MQSKNSKRNILLFILVIILIALVVFVAMKKPVNNIQTNQETNIQTEVKSDTAQTNLKEYKSDKFTFMYNSNSSIEDSGSIGLFITSDKSNTEKGVAVQFRDKLISDRKAYPKGDFYEGQGGGSYVCDNTIQIKDKTFHVCYGATGDNTYQYIENGKMIVFTYSSLDKDALSDNRYIDLSSVEIY